MPSLSRRGDARLTAPYDRRTDGLDGRRRDRLGLIASVIANDGQPFVARVERALRLASEMLGFEAGLLGRIEGGRYTVMVVHAPGYGTEPGSALSLDETFCSLTISRSDVVEIPDASRSPHRDHAARRRLGTQSYVGVPVFVDDREWGTISLRSSQPLDRPLSTDDHDLLRLMALWVGSVLEREAHEHELAEASDQLRAVIEETPIVLFGTDADGVFTLSEGAGLATLGLEAGESVGRCIFDMYPNASTALRCVRRVLEGDAATWEEKIGDAVFASRARPVRGPDGGVTGLIGVSLDITERARSRRALAQSEARFRALSDATSEGIAYVSQGRVVDGNDQLARLFGYESLEGVVGLPASELAAPEYRELVRKMTLDNNTDPYEVVAVRKDGSRFWAEIQGRPAATGSRAERVTAIRDVTARREAEEQRTFQSDVLAQVSDAVMALDLEGRITYWNGGAEVLHGLTSVEVIGRPLAEVVTYLLPELGQITDDAEAALQSEAAKEGNLIFIDPHGVRRFVSVSSSALLDSDGGERGMLAVSRDVTAQRQMSAQLLHQATHDALTGLDNRILFRQRIEQALVDDVPFAVYFIDLDRFKIVNDSLGHEAGDKMLQAIAIRLRNALAHIEGAVIARLGGDEFGVVASTPYPDELGRDLLHALEPPVDLGSRTVSPSASIGLVTHADRYDSPETVLRDADTAMYAAKKNGRGRLATFTGAMHQEATLRFRLEQDLSFAAGLGQIVPHFQPIVDLETGAIAGFEALVRWDHPERGVMPPALFLSLAEETGAIADIDRWILKRTCEEVSTWGAEALDSMAYVSVNCSDKTFLGEGLVAYARQTADDTGLNPDCLVLELTERAVVDLEAAQSVVAAAHDKGLRVAIDDFGAGFSSLGLLHALPVDGVKIDRSFVSDLENSAPARAVVRAVVRLSGELGMRAVAEGIETPGQLRALREAGAHFGQGYLFAKPAPSEVVREMFTVTPWVDDWDRWINGAPAQVGTHLADT
ncbi:sensor domain-containing phosphodiesterase [Rubrivirga sp.]|uniref:sensor domain-containing phosphodiesterase n=1 Tax=Rubrivirga sp. TaxID=1885344 RepID=UPI003C7738C4